MEAGGRGQKAKAISFDFKFIFARDLMSMRVFSRLIIASVATFGSFTVVSAPAVALTFFRATLEGSQEVPPVNTLASGTASFSFEETTNLFELQIEVTGIEVTDLFGVGPNMSPLHIHLAPTGSNGPIVVDLGFLENPVATATGFSLTLEERTFGGRQGNLSSDVDSNVAALLAGDTYINIHTNAFPSGELRGQLTPVPEPTAIFGLMAGIGMASWLRSQNNSRQKTETKMGIE